METTKRKQMEERRQKTEQKDETFRKQTQEKEQNWELHKLGTWKEKERVASYHRCKT